MNNFDYEWIVNEKGILLDPEFDSDSLGWKGGDYFKLVNVNGRQYLVKQDKLVSFIKDGELFSHQGVDKV
jgi:hypothetical protein